MELSEIKNIYVREMKLKTKSQQTIDQYISCINKFTSENSRVYRMSKSDIKNYMADFRHTFGTLTIEHENVFRTKEILGHKSLESTLHYYHIPKNQLKSMYNPLDQYSS